MYKLFSHDGSGGSVVEAALVKAGADFQLIETHTRKDQHREADYVAINPWEQVPSLILPDGTVMTESAAMVIHISTVFADRGIAPRPGTSEHAVFLRWMVFMSANIYEAILRHYYPSRYTVDETGIEGVRDAGTTHMTRAFGLIEQTLGDTRFLCGGSLTIADVYLSMLLAWYPGSPDFPRIEALNKTIFDDPGYGAVWRRHFGGQWVWDGQDG